MNLSSVIKHLIPGGVWLKRTALLLGFILLDFLVTALLCETPYAEANPHARRFMQMYGIVQGLALFDFLMALPIYGLLVIDWHLIKYTKHYRTKTEIIIDITLGWLIAGAHFNGAMSWLWDAPHLIRQTIGFAAYLAVASSFYSFPKRSIHGEIPSLRGNRQRNNLKDRTIRG